MCRQLIFQAPGPLCLQTLAQGRAKQPYASARMQGLAERGEGGMSIPTGLCLERAALCLLGGTGAVATLLVPSPWVAGTESYPQTCPGSWQHPPSPRKEPKSFDTPVVHPFL